MMVHAARPLCYLVPQTIEGDVTINTRLALKAVDEWFAGPVEESCEYDEETGSEG